MAGPFDFETNDPFAGTAGEGTFRNSILGFPTVQERAASSTAAFQARVLEQLGENRSPERFGFVLLQELKTPEGQKALSQPGFLEAIKELQSAITQPAKEFSAEAPGSVAFDPKTGKFGDQAPGKPPEKTAAEKITDAILAAETPEEKALLTAQLPRDPSGRLSVDDFIKVTAAGVQVEESKRPIAVVGMTQQQAVNALALGQSPRAPNSIDLITRGLGLNTGTNLDAMDPLTARGAAVIQQNLRSTESKGFMDVLIAANPALSGLGPKPESVEELFERFDANKGKGAAAPGVKPTGKAAAPGVPLQGGAPGTGPVIETDAGKIAQFEAIPPENFAELSPETLTDITITLQTGKLNLSPEQRTALLAALKAQQEKDSGGTGGTQ